MADLRLTPEISDGIILEGGGWYEVPFDFYESDGTTAIDISANDYEAKLYAFKGEDVLETLTVGGGLTLTSSDDGDNRILAEFDTTFTTRTAGKYRLELIDITTALQPVPCGKLKITIE